MKSIKQIATKIVKRASLNYRITQSRFFSNQISDDKFDIEKDTNYFTENTRDDLNLLSIYEHIKLLNCKGCGIKLQLIDPYKEGYIDHDHVSKHLELKLELKDEKEEKITSNLKSYIKAYKNNFHDNNANSSNKTINIDPIANKEEIEEFDMAEKKFFENFWKNINPKSLVCLRCAKIKQNNLVELTKSELDFARDLKSYR